MRYSYYKKLISEERRQRGPHYGRQARVRQLTIFTSLTLGLYVMCTYNIWCHPRPIHHVWIDGVLVEVVEENWVDHARTGLLYLGLCCAGLLGLLRLCFGVTSSSASPVDDPNAFTLPQQETRGRRGVQKPQEDISTIAVPAWARRRAEGQQVPRNPMEGLPMNRGVPTTAAAMASDRTRTFDASRPMRSDKDLNVFLAYEAGLAQQQQQPQRRLSAGDSIGLRYRGTADDNVYHADVDAVGQGALTVAYERRGLQSGASRRGEGGMGPAAPSSVSYSGGPASTPSTLPWAELGICHVEEALQRTREWMSEVCRKLIDDVDQCDRWFNEHQIEAFDCHHSLQELLPAPTTAAAPAPMATASQARPGGWWGASSAASSFGAPAAPAAPQLEPKLAALLREKAYCRQAQQGMQELDTALRYDQRLALEARLDISGTFPSSSLTRPSNAELTATREYVVDRLRTFAKQRFLVSYNASGGDAETWRSGYPCDAHLLLHVLRVSVKGLSEYLRFGYQTGTQTQDLALCVGDTGEPYFYVRFRQGSSETLLSTQQGPTSLMEAVLAFAAVIHTYYRDVFGGIRGTVDLAEVGLLKVVTEGRRPAWGEGVGGEW
ncbi:hypothetical protein ABL78_3302 [Leptomonas seymouri]|uniref:Uncharacterized protein n=1 Tax=Leptomonas seymouri TaxID=5684 RepID=A0A0N1HZR5_LEPSE|nr:hypothetical protein ABL78_3302 [Leptomonas seymouri]|eukprot:KPI87645.1 hypothetical protein ABL78_3302 [Leptomonas seymouri]